MLGAAGVPYDLSRMGEFCTNHRPTGAAARDCQYGDTMTVEEWRAVGLPPGSSEKVDGFRGLLLFEPAIGPSFQANDLAALQVPVHVVASRPGDFLSFEAHAKYIVDSMPQGTLLVLEGGEGHFIFLEECTYDLLVLGLPLCKDAPGVDRAEAHRALLRDAISRLEGWAPR
jgi:predicted dienelactone hydrolase